MQILLHKKYFKRLYKFIVHVHLSHDMLDFKVNSNKQENFVSYAKNFMLTELTFWIGLLAGCLYVSPSLSQTYRQTRSERVIFFLAPL